MLLHKLRGLFWSDFTNSSKRKIEIQKAEDTYILAHSWNVPRLV